MSGDGIVLRGDANAAPGTLSVTAAAVHGVGVLRVALTVVGSGALAVHSRVKELDSRHRAPPRRP